MKGKNLIYVLAIGFFSIVLHYAFTYIGLSTTDSSKTALIKQLGALIYVCFDFLFFKDEKFNVLKIIGAIIGFGGIIAINFNSSGIFFSLGDILIIGASICTVVSGVLTKKSVEKTSPFWITAISQFSGGIILFATAVIMGADMLKFDLKAFAVFAYICTASTVAYVLWNVILKTYSVSKMFIIKFAEPLFACVFGAILLGEDIFKIQYLLAFVLISTGIILGNRSEASE